MSRSIKKSIAIPQPIREGILSHVQSGVIGYPPDLQDAAIRTVVLQAEALAAEVR